MVKRYAAEQVAKAALRGIEQAGLADDFAGALAGPVGKALWERVNSYRWRETTIGGLLAALVGGRVWRKLKFLNGNTRPKSAESRPDVTERE